jgi:hypothetical protein
MSKYDLSADGNLSFPEFCRMMAQMQPESAEDRLALLESDIATARQIFDEFDTDKSDSISKVELKVKSMCFVLFLSHSLCCESFVVNRFDLTLMRGVDASILIAGFPDAHVWSGL